MAGGVVALVCEGQPPTANNVLRPAGEAFLTRVREAFAATGAPLGHGLLYGVVYWFVRSYKRHTHPDADDLSKKVWDALEGLAYPDDKQVRLRLAAVVDLGVAGGVEALPLEQLDLSGAPEAVPAALGRLLAGPDIPGDPRTRSFTYIEFGPLGTGMIRFNLAPQPAATEEGR